MQTHSFAIAMASGGDSGKVERVLKRLEGVSSFDISLEDQTAAVTTDLSHDIVFEALKKSGLPVETR
ncbi:heavy metal-associated domain-containing protein [Streptomyces sp. NPDC089915]|uniref:heavy-metal-associated domain-containing protein n=1 Tax=Streptomyces sp. NPDC089915 TaxID=3155186 RepID=UPI003429F007